MNASEMPTSKEQQSAVERQKPFTVKTLTCPAMLKYDVSPKFILEGLIQKAMGARDVFVAY